MPLKTDIALRLRTARKKIRALQENLLLVFIWPIFAVLLCIIGWSILFAALERDREQVENASLGQAALLARGYAEQIARTLGATNRFMLHVRYRWQLSGRHIDLAEEAKSGLYPSSSLFFMAVADEKGNLVTSTITGEEHINIADRPYFIAQRDSPGDLLYIGTPSSAQMTNSNVVQFSRKLTDPAGNFRGIVLASVSPAYLMQDYDNSALGRNGYLGILGSSNNIRLARIGETILAPSSPALAVLPTFETPAGSTLMRGDIWFRDGRNRFVGWHEVRDQPLFALTGLDAQAFLAPLLARRATTIRLGWAATAVLGIFTLVAMQLSMRLAWRKHELRIAQATYRKATEEGHEGFYIARPIGRNGLAHDYQVIDCNSYGAELFGLRRSELIGKRISSFGEGSVAPPVLDALHQAHETGFYEGELQVPETSSIIPDWLYVKAIQTEGDLAISLRDVSDTKAHLQELERRSNEDELTGLPNRHWVKTYLTHAVSRATQEHTGLAILYIDLDGFKTVNDTMGHAAGDELLCNAAQRLKLAVRPQDHVARLGGDEFMLLLEHIDSLEDIAPVAERVLRAFKQNFRLTQGTHKVGTSIGVSVFPQDGKDGDTLLRHADIAMYAVKTSGKSNYRFYDPKLYEAVRTRHEQESELRHAIETDQFIMHYQPRVDVATGMISSMESLVRWNHPTKGMVEPNRFIPLAEETGLIIELGALIIDKVIAQIAMWEKGGKDVVPVSINVSPRQFREMDVARLVSTALARHEVEPGMVEIEVTESSMMGDSEEVDRTLAAFQEMGVKLLVDDFGTGYSSLSQLQRLDFDVLKVDRAFTSRIDSSEEGNVFFKAIVTMAHALGMRVVAEGVENAEQARILTFLQCDELQGFFISRPLPPSEMQPVLPRQSFATGS